LKPLQETAESFYTAFYEKKWAPTQGAISVDTLTVEEAYCVQDLVTKKRLLSGESIVGYKVGCTSKAIRTQFNLNEPIHAKLFKPRIYSENATMNLNDYVDCAIEPEMVLKIGKDLIGENLPDEVLRDAIEYVSPGIELHNYRFWNQPPTIQELICSGGIHAGMVIGNEKVIPSSLTFADEVFRVYKNNSLMTSASAVEIMGGPMYSLRWLVSSLTMKGLTLKEGSIVIPGSPTELVNIEGRTDLKISIDHVGSVKALFDN